MPVDNLALVLQLEDWITHFSHLAFCWEYAAAFRFQPIKRPQLASQKPKTKLGLPKAAVFSSASPIIASSASAAPRVPSVKSTLADWTAADEEDVNGFYGGEKRQRGGRKKRKKNHEFEQAQNWDDIYDPTRPTNYEEYQHSEEKVREVQEWKGRLYAHRMIGRTSDVDSDPDEPQQRNCENPNTLVLVVTLTMSTRSIRASA